MQDTKSLDPRKRIWNAALKHFAASGYAGTGVQQIVDEAGVTKPTLYYHFGSKAELYEKLIESAYTERLKIIENAAAKHSGIVAQLTDIGESQVEFARQHKELVRLCYATTFAAPGELPPGIRTLERSQKVFDFVQSLLMSAMDRGEIAREVDPEELTMAIYSQYMILSISIVLVPETLRPGIVQRMVNMFMDGARNCCTEKKSQTTPRVLKALNL